MSVRAQAHTARRFDEDLLVAMPAPSRAGLRRLARWGISPWQDHPHGPTWVFHVPAQARAQLDVSGLDYVVVEPDLQAALERAGAFGTPPSAGLPADFFADFRDLPTIEAQLDAWVAERPDRVEAMTAGTSFEGRPIRGIRICDATPKGDAPVFLVNGTQHAREWLGTMSTMYVADALVHADGDPVLEAAISEFCFVVIPVVNPDGFVFTWSDDRLWRKNRTPDYGVDLNRNWQVAWGGDGASLNPLSNNYRGDSPLSEPETAALATLVADLEPVAHLDVHTFGQLVLSPWSWTLDPPSASGSLEPLATSIAQAMTDVEGFEYHPLRAAQLYAAAGTFPDHTYGTLGTRAFTLELRPEDAEPNDVGFVPGVDQIAATGEEALAATLTLAEAVANARPLPPGDDGGAPPPHDDTTTGGHDVDDPSTTSGSMTSTGAEPEPGGSSSSGGDAPPPAIADEMRVDDVTSACACRGDATPTPARWWWVIVVGLGRRRRAPTTQAD